MKRFFNIVIITGLIWAVVATVNNYNNIPHVSAVIEEKPLPNFRAPSFTLEGIDQKQYEVNTNLNKPVVLNFWASWCTPCRIEAPELQAIHEAYKGRVDILAVNMTKGDTMDGVENFVMENQLTFPILLDPTGQVTKQYRIIAVPTTFFINKQGVIVDQIIGYGGKGIFKEKIEDLIEN